MPHHLSWISHTYRADFRTHTPRSVALYPHPLDDRAITRVMHEARTHKHPVHNGTAQPVCVTSPYVPGAGLLVRTCMHPHRSWISTRKPTLISNHARPASRVSLLPGSPKATKDTRKSMGMDARTWTGKRGARPIRSFTGLGDLVRCVSNIRLKDIGIIGLSKANGRSRIDIVT